MKKSILAFVLVCILLIAGCVHSDGPIIQNLCDGTHADVNYNGECDYCHQSVMTTIDFYAVNDLHGKVDDGENHPGVDEMTTYFENAKRTDDNVIILSIGDMWQGSAESNMTKGLLVTDWMNDVGFAAMTLGNHEYDWGEYYIEANAESAAFPFLAINIYDRNTDERVSYCDASVVIEVEGLQIGIIGAMGDCYSSIAADKSENVYFKTGSELTRLVKDESERLRSEGVDFIIYALHDGYGQSIGSTSSVMNGSKMASYYDISLSDGYVDLVFEGHTHQQYLFKDQYGVYHLQNRGDNKGGISHVEIEINTVTGSYSVELQELVSGSTYSSLEDDPIVEDLLEKYRDEISPANRILGNNSTFRSGDSLRQLVADLYYALGREEWGDEYDIVLGGGFISVRSPYDLKAGEVTYAQLQSLFPFDNDLVLCSVKGSDLLAKFINTSNRNYFICCDSSLKDQIDPNGTYYIVVDTYTSSYAPNRLTVVEAYQTGIYARDLLAQYIEDGHMN